MSSLSTSSTQISIFDIPHIIESICDDLPRDQLLTCLDVSRAWRTNFTPQALRYVRFSNLKSHQTWVILRRAGLIRSLTIDIADGGWFLDNPDAAICTNLRELRCVDFNYQPKPRPGAYILYDKQPSIVDQSNNALRLIGSCSKLETLVVDNLSYQYRTDHFTEAVLKSIYTCTSLTTIKLHLNYELREFWTVLIKSLPVGLEDFEFSVIGWIPAYSRRLSPSFVPEQIYPKDGYPWQQQGQQDFAESSSVSGSQILPLKRLALGELHSRLLGERTVPGVVIDHVVSNPAFRRRHPCSRFDVTTEMVKSCVERSSGLRHLVLKRCGASWTNTLQLLLDNCPDLETIDFGRISRYFNRINISTSDTIQFIGSFPALKEFRISGYMPEDLYESVAVLLVRSAATLEVVRINCSSNEQRLDANPFHIGTMASWTQCTRLRELQILRNGGSMVTDYRWDIAKPFSVWDPIKDYSAVFGQLEKLHLAVREPLWDQCPDQSYVVLDPDSWYEEEDADELDEQDDEDWKPLKTVNQTVEKKNLERHKRRVGRNHKRAFIIQVRELFGRLKELEQLRELEIDWTVCYSISEMFLGDALELFRETEVRDDRYNSEYERTSRGWWGEMTEEDLVWLCLPWASRPNIESSRVPSDIIIAAARQYENKTQLLSGCHGIRDCSCKQPPWRTGDIYNTRVGRTWRDWGELTEARHPTYKERCVGCGRIPLCLITSVFTYELPDPYQKMDHNHVVNSPEFEVFVEGLLGGSEEARWGRKKATKGEGGRYRQKVASKMNQRK